MNNHDVMLGTANWRVPDWLGSFYPSDMPAEWRLAYYNTQFSCVWLPYEAWARISPQIAQEWLNDTRSEFRFLLEAGDAETDHERKLLEILAPRLGLHGRTDHPDLIWFDADVDLRVLSEALRQRSASDGVTYLLSRDANLVTLNKVDTLLDLLNMGRSGRVG